MMEKRWMRKKAFAAYADVSERTVANWLNMGLPSAKVAGGTRLIHLEKADAWLEQFMVADPSESIDSMVNEILEDLQK